MNISCIGFLFDAYFLLGEMSKYNVYIYLMCKELCGYLYFLFFFNLINGLNKAVYHLTSLTTSCKLLTRHNKCNENYMSRFENQPDHSSNYNQHLSEIKLLITAAMSAVSEV